MAISMADLLARMELTIPPDSTAGDQTTTDELALLFHGDTFEPSALAGAETEINIDQLIKTDRYCPECTGLGKCRMLHGQNGWQTLYGGSARGRPVFKMRLCRYADQKIKQEGLFSPRAVSIYSFSTYEVTAENGALLKACLEYTRNFTQFTTKGLLLMGGNGVGKTHLAVSIAKALARRGYDAGMMDVEAWLNKIRESYDDNKVDPETEGLIAKKLLVIDDLVPEQRVTDWVKSQVLIVLNHRYNQMLPTVITTDKPMRSDNPNVRSVESVYGQRIPSRLMEMCDVITVQARDWRRRKPAPEQHPTNGGKKVAKKGG